ncbi:Uncharacterised protein [Klebsiella pneumoniae]|uniref:Uncharacterized protein n=1 Tax=Klebsiella pneumoniae TaxID=573 RepID=A0A378AUG9_KLEPN|nr:Uncharacterised protein [Klebsiella pneumoniae]
MGNERESSREARNALEAERVKQWNQQQLNAQLLTLIIYEVFMLSKKNILISTITLCFSIVGCKEEAKTTKWYMGSP